MTRTRRASKRHTGGSESGIKPLAGLAFLALIVYVLVRIMIGAI